MAKSQRPRRPLLLLQLVTFENCLLGIPTATTVVVVPSSRLAHYYFNGFRVYSSSVVVVVVRLLDAVSSSLRLRVTASLLVLHFFCVFMFFV